MGGTKVSMNPQILALSSHPRWTTLIFVFVWLLSKEALGAKGIYLLFNLLSLFTVSYIVASMVR